MSTSIRIGPGCSIRMIRGLWHVVFYDAQKDPRQISRSLRTPHEDVALEKAREKNALFKAGIWNPWKDAIRSGTLAEAIKAYTAFQESMKLKPRTLRSNASRLKMLKERIGGNVNLRKITSKDVTSALYRVGVQRDPEKPPKQLADSTIYGMQQTYQAFFSWCVEGGYITESPMKEVPRQRMPKPPPDFLTLPQFNRLIIAIEHDYAEKLPMLRNLHEIIWVREVCILGAFLGLRRTEICNLEWKHVIMPAREGDQAWIDVTYTDNGGPKYDSTGRLPVPMEALEALERCWARRTGREKGDYVVKGAKGGKLNPDYVSGRITYYMRKAGLSGKPTLHTLRHTAATWLMLGGADLSRTKALMRHEDISTTLRYQHAAPEYLVRTQNDAFAKLRAMHREDEDE